MSEQEFWEPFLERGWHLIQTRVNRAGRVVHLVQLDSGHTIAMFHGDAAQLVSGRTTLEQIVTRNQGADLAGLP